MWETCSLGVCRCEYQVSIISGRHTDCLKMSLGFICLCSIVIAVDSIHLFISCNFIVFFSFPGVTSISLACSKRVVARSARLSHESLRIAQNLPPPAEDGATD